MLHFYLQYKVVDIYQIFKCEYIWVMYNDTILYPVIMSSDENPLTLGYEHL